MTDKQSYYDDYVHELRAENERLQHDAAESMKLVQVQGARIHDLNAEIQRLRTKLEELAGADYPTKYD